MNCAVESLFVMLQMIYNRLRFLHSWVVEWIPWSSVGYVARRRRILDELECRVSESSAIIASAACFLKYFCRGCFRREIDALQSAMSSWYARFKADTKLKLQRQLQEVFSRPRRVGDIDSSSCLKAPSPKTVANPPTQLEGVALRTFAKYTRFHNHSLECRGE